MKNERILILGAGGFIGNRIFHRFKSKDYTVFGTDRKGKYLPLDVLQQDWRDFLIELQPTVIVNCIAYGNAHHHDDEELIKKTNLDFPKELIAFCHQHLNLRAFIQFGSSSEYGTNCTNAREDFTLKPNSKYSEYKGLLSEWCYEYSYKYNFRLIYFRLFSIYGPGEAENRLIPTLLENAKAGKFPLLGDANIARDFVYVDDVVRAVKKAIKRSDKLAGQIFNVCSGKQLQLKEVCALLAKHFYMQEDPQFGTRPNHKWDLVSWYGNPTKAQTYLKWSAKISLEEFFASEAAKFKKAK